MDKKILIVGGSWNENGGRPSGIVRRFAELLRADKVFNGGYINNLPQILQSVTDYKIVLWWANVPNHFEKIRDVKSVNQKALLVTSKRNDNDKYSFAELISRSLAQKANLTLEFSKVDELYHMRLFDPLGTLWYEGSNVEDCAKSMKERLIFLSGITRIPSIKAGEKVEAPDIPDFYEYVRSCAEVFHELINPAKNTTRFLGNTSFRCRSGFPSFRVDNGIFVSRRNIDKRHISKDAFVFACLGENGETMYFGDQKPSVDTPIQLRLYNLFPKINFMIHGHCYVDNGIFTQFPIPCGGIEEVEEILKIVPDTEGTRYAINLIGHGCLLMGATVKDLKCFKFIERPMPEKLNL